MEIVKTGLRRGIVAAAWLVAGAGVSAAPAFRHVPTPGVRAYRYTVVQTINHGIQRGYRVDFGLAASADGSVDAILRTSEELGDGHWRPTVVDPACRARMHGNAASLARVRLWPLAPRAAAQMGNDFLDTCAPPGIFFPLTDILNAVVVPLSPSFNTASLRSQGQSAHYAGFTAAFDRAGETLREVTEGGDVRLVTLDRGQAVIDWQPLLATLDLVEHSGPTPLTLHGTEHYAFRITLDRRTGAIRDAHTLFDDLDLNVVGAPGAPHVVISRSVTITPL